MLAVLALREESTTPTKLSDFIYILNSIIVVPTRPQRETVSWPNNYNKLLSQGVIMWRKAQLKNLCNLFIMFMAFSPLTFIFIFSSIIQPCIIAWCM